MDHSMELSVNVDKLRQQIATLSNPMDGDSADSDSLQSRLVYYITLSCHGDVCGFH